VILSDNIIISHHHQFIKNMSDARVNKMFCGIKSCHTCSNAVFRHWHSPTIVLLLVFFIAMSMIRCSKSAQNSAVQVCQVATVVRKHTAGSKPIYKLFIVVNGELNKVSLAKNI